MQRQVDTQLCVLVISCCLSRYDFTLRFCWNAPCIDQHHAAVITLMLDMLLVLQVKDYGDLSYLVEAEYERQLVALSQDAELRSLPIGTRGLTQGKVSLIVLLNCLCLISPVNSCSGCCMHCCMQGKSLDGMHTRAYSHAYSHAYSYTYSHAYSIQPYIQPCIQHTAMHTAYRSFVCWHVFELLCLRSNEYGVPRSHLVWVCVLIWLAVSGQIYVCMQTVGSASIQFACVVTCVSLVA